MLTLPAVAGPVFLLGGRARRLAAVGAAGLSLVGIVPGAAYAIAASAILAAGMASAGKIILTGHALVASPAPR